MTRLFFLLFLLLTFPAVCMAQSSKIVKTKQTSDDAAAAANSASETKSEMDETDSERADGNAEGTPETTDEEALALSNATRSESDESETEQANAPKSTVTVEWGGYALTPEGATPLLMVMPNDKTPSPDSYTVPRTSKRAESHPATWKTNTEWLSVAAALNTYGVGGTLSVATLRWDNVYWDTATLHVGAWKRTKHAFVSSMAGMPFWLSARHEFRVGVGLAVGYLSSRKGITANEEGFEDSGITASIAKSYLMLPLEGGYIFHFKKHLAFFANVSLAIPLVFRTEFESNQNIDSEDYEIRYRPLFGIAAGIRL